MGSSIHPCSTMLPGHADAELIVIRGLDDDELLALNVDRSLYLDLEELRVIRDEYERLGRDITDVEIETLAQTWSEHCAHKTFRAVIDATGGPDGPAEITPLMAQLRACTESIDAPFVRSAFVGNAGVIEFTEGTTIALKAETHNHPSAVEPFGGANTGVGGVIRDVLGIAHRPIAVTDILCFGPTELPMTELPDGALHPSRIREGVIDGVADYGNKIGLPTVAGAVLYDPAYTTNPLVFAGCIGTAPSRPIHDGPFPGDRVVVFGGATGRDGIRGATFSSATMDATTGEVAGASVQIGDPIVEKLLIDALIGAEDLYSAITDCGAGGLSSAIGEMAEGVGADVDLDHVPRKYPGLDPWEVWLSEAQERMVIAVPPQHLAAMQERCDRVGVSLADVGAFTGDGQLLVRHQGHLVVDIDTAFLHDGRPQRRMPAELPTPNRNDHTGRNVTDPRATILALLAHPNIASKADIIHRYDHEILGATVVRPLDRRKRRRPRRRRRARRPVRPRGHRHRDRRQPLVRPPRPRGDGVRRDRRGDPQRRCRRRRPRPRGPARQLLVGRPEAAFHARRAGGRRRRMLRRRPHVRRSVRVGQGLAQQRIRRRRRPTPRGAPHPGDHGGRPRSRCRPLRHPRPRRSRQRTDPDRPDRGRVRRLPSRPRAGRTRNVGVAPAPDPDAPETYRHLHAAIRAGLVVACHDVSEGGLAVSIAEMCIAGRLGARSRRTPARRPRQPHCSANRQAGSWSRCGRAASTRS